MLDIKVKLNQEDAILPQYQTTGSAGFDLHSCDQITLQPGEVKLVNTGLIFDLQEGQVLLVCSRSGLALKHQVHVLNSPGVVDSDYRGEIKVVLKNSGTDLFEINKGDRIAQGMIFENIHQAQFHLVSHVSSTDRGEGGFGSTGLNSN